MIKKVLVIAGLPVAMAWWDEGHMVVSTIAKRMLSPEHVKELETILEETGKDWTGMNGLENASVWMDHVRCKGYTPGCEHNPSLDNNQMLYEFHFADTAFNPHKLKPSSAEDLVAFIPASHSNPVKMIKQALTSIAEQVESTHDSTGTYLRSLLHVVGDLHQPLHTFSALCHWASRAEEEPTERVELEAPFSSFLEPRQPGDSRPSAKTDMGGNMVLLKGDDVPNLHAFWDSAGGLYPRSWPEFGSHANYQDIIDLHNEAARVVAAHPEVVNGTYADLLVTGKYTDGEKWLTQSVSSMPEKVYQEVIESCLEGRQFNERPHKMSAEYKQWVKEESEKRIVLAGIRLGHVLEAAMVKRNKNRKNGVAFQSEMPEAYAEERM